MAENKITQKEINNIVWKACDTLRPVMGSEQYKDYILTLLFIKYLSDVWKDKVEQYRIKYPDNEEMVKRLVIGEKEIKLAIELPKKEIEKILDEGNKMKNKLDSVSYIYNSIIQMQLEKIINIIKETKQ